MSSTLPQHRHPPGFRWPSRTLWDDVSRHARSRGSAHAVSDGDGDYSYGRLMADSVRLAHHYRELGVRDGDVVVVQMPGIRHFVPAFLAAERLGAIVCPMLPALTGRSFGVVADLALPRLVVTANDPGDLDGIPSGVPIVTSGQRDHGLSLERLLETVEASAAPLPAPPGPGALCELAFTSGTTGAPKGVLHSHATATAGIRSTIERQEIGPDDVVHVALPVGHNFGYFYGVRLGLHAGAHVVLQRRWSAAEMLELGERHGVTVGSGPPAFLSDLVDLRTSWRGRLDSLRVFTCAGAKLSPDLAREAVGTLPGRLSRAFGMTELGHVTSTTAGSPLEKIVATEGHPHPEIEMRVLGSGGELMAAGDEGEIAFRGPFLMLGYRNPELSDAIDEDGFFRTGDLGYRDADGYMVLTGRVKNMVIRGGENIPAEAVERALAGHDAIIDVVVVGVPDARLGERPVACVVARDGVVLTVEDLGATLEVAGIPKIHHPEAVVMVDEVAVGETGKVRRAEMREIAAGAVTFDRGLADG